MQAIHRHSVSLVFLCAILLAGTGLVMLASTGAYATDGTAVDYTGLKRQSAYLVLGLLACLGGAMLDYRLWERHFMVVFALVVLALGLCFAPRIGMNINGENRWISARAIGAPWLRLQPSELGKLGLIMLLAWWYARIPLRVKSFWRGFVFPLGLACIPIGLVAFERDLGTAALMAAVLVGVMFIAGVRPVYLLACAALAGGALVTAVQMIPQRMARWLAFLDLETHRMDAGLQQWRAMLALGSGGVGGRGFGNGIEKMFYLPYAHTDFIFPMIGEEFGLFGTLAVILLFVMFIIGGFAVAAMAPDGFGRLLGSGMVLLVGCQGLMNMAVTTSLLPNKGLPLPFISYGGSSLVVMFFMLGILINLYRQGQHGDRRSRSLLEDVPAVTPRL
jgi:cell division protein FtsW